MVSPTTNRGMTYPTHGGAVNAWDSPLNADIENIDLAFATYGIALSTSAGVTTFSSGSAVAASSVANITIPSSIGLNFHYPITGVVTQNMNLVFPAVGGFYDVYNNSSGAFTLTAITAAAGSSGIAIGQGGRTFVVSDGTNVYAADSNVIARMYSYLGSPTGSVPGNAAASNGALTDFVWDATNRQLNAAVTTGTSATAVWQVVGPVLPEPQGYLTPVSNTPIITADSTSTNLYYPFYKGPWVVLSNGSALYPYQLPSQLSLPIPSSMVATGDIHDVFIANSSAGVILGVGPNWTVGGGSITAGSGARGNGAGSTQLSFLDGFRVNTVAMTLGSGSTAISVSSGVAVYYGSIYASTTGTVTCHRSWGQNRMWGVWNAFNRSPTFLKAGDNTANWSTNVANLATRVSNASSANCSTVFSGLAEDTYDVLFTQKLAILINSNNTVGQIGIGINSTNSFSGKLGYIYGTIGGGSGTLNPYNDCIGTHISAPSMGINNIYCLENEAGSGGTTIWYGTEQCMELKVIWRA